jgi:hypothetical protein
VELGLVSDQEHGCGVARLHQHILRATDSCAAPRSTLTGGPTLAT